ncbi:hypothetical protein [Vibrio sp. 10N.261.52.F3]|uniref:hypothetical protein n=1 Tax=Vibrio sp. 10N.261.52.F3 TaxID=3229683 RepID=UPI00354E3429
MLFRESGKAGNESVRFVRTFYCAEAKGARQKTLGKIKKADVSYTSATENLLAEFKQNEATDAELAEVKEWLDVMVSKQKADQHHNRKNSLLVWLEHCANTPDDALDLLSAEDQTALFGSIKKLEERLREKGIKRPRKPRK